jgi:hypothetical protein
MSRPCAAYRRRQRPGRHRGLLALADTARVGALPASARRPPEAAAVPRSPAARPGGPCRRASRGSGRSFLRGIRRCCQRPCAGWQPPRCPGAGGRGGPGSRRGGRRAVSPLVLPVPPPGPSGLLARAWSRPCSGFAACAALAVPATGLSHALARGARDLSRDPAALASSVGLLRPGNILAAAGHPVAFPAATQRGRLHAGQGQPDPRPPAGRPAPPAPSQEVPP